MLAAQLGVSAALAQDAASSDTPPGVHVSFEAPADAECGSPEAFRVDVSRRVGAPVFSEQSRASRRVVVRVSRTRSGYRGALVLSNAADQVVAERVIEGAAGCNELVRTLSVVLATYLGMREPEPLAAEPASDDDAPAEEPAPEPVPPPTLPAPDSAPPARAVRVAPPPSARPPPSYSLAFGPLMGAGLLPRPAPALSAMFAAASDAWSAHVGPLIFPRVQTELGGDASASFTGYLLRAQACAALAELTHVRLSACAGARAGLLVSRSAGLARNVQTRIAVGELELGMRLSGEAAWLGRRAGWYGGLGATLPLSPPRFSFTDADGMSRRYHEAIPGIWAELGVQLRLGSEKSRATPTHR